MRDFNPSAEQAWLLLVVAGLLEVAWAVGLKYTEGFSRWLPITLVLLVALASMALLALAMKAIPVGTAYAAWVGIGAAGAMLAGVALFGEPATAGRIASALLIVAGVVGLKISDG